MGGFWFHRPAAPTQYRGIDTTTADGCLVAADLAEERGRPRAAEFLRDLAAEKREAAWLRRVRRKIRTAGGLRTGHKLIVVKDGAAAPSVVVRDFCFRHVEVGRDWLTGHGLPASPGGA